MSNSNEMADSEQGPVPSDPLLESVDGIDGTVASPDGEPLESGHSHSIARKQSRKVVRQKTTARRAYERLCTTIGSVLPVHINHDATGMRESRTAGLVGLRRRSDAERRLPGSAARSSPPSLQEPKHLLRKKPKKKTTLRLWWMELLSIAISLACLAINVCVLAILDNKHYESWRFARVDITPNAIISITATLGRASLLLPIAEVVVQLKWLYFQARMHKVSDLQIFDDASRGPLGSLVLLWKVNLRSAIASIAAAVIVLAIAIEPFTQQVIRYPTRPVPARNVSAIIGATTVFQASSMFGMTATQSRILQSTTLHQLSVAAEAGITNPAANTKYNCPSGSCTWPSFSSLALCNSCRDLSNATVSNCYQGSNMTSGYRLCNYFFSNDYMSTNDMYNGLSPVWNVWQSMGNGTYRPSTWLNISSDVQDVLATPGMTTWLDVVRFRPSYYSLSPSAPDDIIPTILRCEITFCAKYYPMTRFVNGMLFDSPEFGVPLVSNGGGYEPDSSQIPPALSQKLNNTSNLFEIDISVGQYFHSSLLSSLSAVVFNNDMMESATRFDYPHLPQRYTSEAHEFVTDGGRSGKLYSLYYANDGNSSETLDNIAVSVTNQMRSGPDAKNITGTTTYPVVYIEVVWGWLVYTAVLTVCAAVLLTLTIWISTGEDAVVWKSSSLALIFHGLPADQTDGKVLDAESMENAASDIWARLAKDQDGSMSLRVR